MPPQIAATICAIFIIYLFWGDVNKRDGSSWGLWIPLIYMFLCASRPVSMWLDLGVPQLENTEAYIEGNPLNAAISSVLIIAGILVLLRRRINWSEVLTKNAWVWLFFLYGGISIIWSDYPFVSFKRLIKAFGNVVLALIILTEHRPYEALGTIFRRLAFVCLPLSILFIKYYPSLGRAYHATGAATYTGVATQKNGLGNLCLLLSTYFSWKVILDRSTEDKLKGFLNALTNIVLVIMFVWLFYMANSATSLACALIAALLFIFGRSPLMSNHPKRILLFAITCIALFFLLEWSTDIKDQLLSFLGRRPDLTTRVPMWEHLLSMVRNPIIGFGYESFWLGERMEIVQARWGRLIQAHNGYLEIYLNLGLIGLFLLAGQVVSGMIKVVKQLPVDYPAALLRFSFIVIILLYNYTEATFYGVNNMWILFLLGIMDIPSVSKQITQTPNE